jgi:hypothetical protein
MWCKATKEAHIYETNFKSSLQMILAPKHEEQRISLAEADDGVPSIEKSKSRTNEAVILRL